MEELGEELDFPLVPHILSPTHQAQKMYDFFLHFGIANKWSPPTPEVTSSIRMISSSKRHEKNVNNTAPDQSLSLNECSPKYWTLTGAKT